MAVEKILRESWLTNLSSTPSGAVNAGYVSFYAKNNVVYKKIGTVETPLELPMVALGELAVHNGTTIVKFPKGSNTQRLAVVDGSPEGIAYLDEFTFTRAGIAGENIPNRFPVREGVASLGEDPNKIYKCDASSPDKIGFIGFAYTDYLTDEDMTILQGPRVDGFTSLVDQDDYYLADGPTVGISNTPGTNVFQVGSADGTTAIVGVKAQTTIKEYIETTVFETITVENLVTNEITFWDERGVAGEAIADRDPVRMGVTSLGEDETKVYKCDAANADKIGFVGFASKDYAVGEKVVVLQGPRVDGFTGLTDGANYFLKNGGGIDTTPGTNIVLVGSADGTRTLVGVRADGATNNYVEINGEVITTNTTEIYAKPGDFIVYKVMTSDSTVYLPQGTQGSTVTIKKRTGEHVHKVNVEGLNGDTIDDNPDGAYFDVSNETYRFAYIGSTWETR